MIKYILHGGHSTAKNENNKRFFQKIAGSVNNGSTILLNYFAHDKSRWQKKSEDDILNIKKQSHNKSIKFKISSLKKFSKQLDKANLLYIRGGETDLLLGRLKKYSNLKELFEGKTIVGSSAGAYALSKYFYRNSLKEVSEGLGILNVKVFCYYAEEKKERARELSEFGEKLETIALPECESVVLFK